MTQIVLIHGIGQQASTTEQPGDPVGAAEVLAVGSPAFF